MSFYFNRYQRPNTPHYVLTTQHSVALGRHFFAMSSIVDSCHQIIHSFVLRYNVTNQLHYNTRTLLYRILTNCVNYYLDADLLPCKLPCILRGIPTYLSMEGTLSRPPHIMNVTEVEGVLAIMTVGNVIELASALDHRVYENLKLEDQDILEHEAAMTRYRLFTRWFSDRFCLWIGDNWINPLYLFQKRLVDFATTIFHYQVVEHPKLHREDRIRDFNTRLGLH